ncbi:hypothetical protein RPIT_02310 [Tessaracoccus flavus]|uniref:Uncharacterized protein n=1 Tax=Tessaracoccus flavus TaxID=1610493 RepID=A0A1Q2CCE8_9ACTN|nr:hypothetical protein RPIT_02310 [Tessaracoccus flavus]
MLIELYTPVQYLCQMIVPFASAFLSVHDREVNPVLTADIEPVQLPSAWARSGVRAIQVARAPAAAIFLSLERNC